MTIPDAGVYGALANVAAITTALQSAVALLPLSRAIGLARKKRDSLTTDPEYVDAKKEANRDFWVFLLLNIVSAGINGSVLAAWSKVGTADFVCDQWSYWLPWVAVAAGAGVLLITALGSLIWLGQIAWRG